MSDRGRSRTPRSLSRSPVPKKTTGDDVSMGSRSPSPAGKRVIKSRRDRSGSDMSISPTRSQSRSRAPASRKDRARSRSVSRSVSRGPRRSRSRGEKRDGSKVIVISHLTRSVHKGHLEEIFGHYGKIIGIDLPVVRGGKSTRTVDVVIITITITIAVYLNVHLADHLSLDFASQPDTTREKQLSSTLNLGKLARPSNTWTEDR